MKENKNVLEVVAETEILGKNIKMYGSVEEPYFVASDVADWLGERDGYTVGRKVDDEDKDIYNVKTNGGIQKVTMLTKNGLIQALSCSRKLHSKELLHILSPDFVYKRTPKQVEFEAMLKDAIKYHLESKVDLKQCPFNDSDKYYKEYVDCLNYYTEYKILNYRVDFFFEDFGIIVEYDEYEHNYKTEQDNIRQYEIENYLNKIKGNENWENEGSLITFIRVKEGEEFKGIIEIITHLMSVFI